ncbi:uncharacterized protein [Physcomitrium patens]|uniref:uncharacterized protein n=1 Tax=Physcomitrium patens TaxID=3218 RepID=UPI003CCDF9E5
MVMAFLGEVAASERRITYAITIWTPRWPITAVVSCGPRLLFERTHAFTHARVILSSAMVPVESVETCCAIRDPRGGIDPALKMSSARWSADNSTAKVLLVVSYACKRLHSFLFKEPYLLVQ